MERLEDSFADLPDPRTGNATRHDLLETLTIALCATLCGAESCVDMALFGKAKEALLRQFLVLEHGVSSHDTFSRIFPLLDPDAFQACFQRFLSSFGQALRAEGVIAIDGKSVRRSFDRAAGRSALRLISAWSCEHRLVLGQARVAEGSNEIDAMPAILRLLDLKGRLVTADAMHCQRDTAQAILAAYVHKQRTGEGQMVDTSLLEAGIAYTPWESAIYWADGTVPVPFGTAHRISAPYQAYRTADGWLVIGAANQKIWVRMCRTIGREALATDPRFADNQGRITRLDELNAELAPVFATRTTADWLARLEAAGVPAGPIHDMAEVWGDPHVRARDMLVETEHPRAGTVPNIGVPVKLSETPAAVRKAAPLFGQHTGEVLAEIGVAADELRALHADGVIYDATTAGDLPAYHAAEAAGS